MTALPNESADALRERAVAAEARIAAHRFDGATALRLAQDAAPHVTVNGRTAADAYRLTVGEA